MVNVPNVNNKSTVDVSFCPVEHTTSHFIEAANASAASEPHENKTVPFVWGQNPDLLSIWNLMKNEFSSRASLGRRQ